MAEFADPPSDHDLKIRDLPSLLLSLARNPIDTMKSRASLGWRTAWVLQVAAAALSGAIAALNGGTLFDVAIGILVFPIFTTMIAAIFTLFLYYYFSVFTATMLDIRHLLSIVTLALFPYFVLHAFSGFLPPLDLLGFVLTTILCMVALVEQLGLDRKPVAVVAGIGCAIFFVAWSLVRAGFGGLF